MNINENGRKVASWTYISLFTGIGGCAVAFQKLGWEAMCFAETDPFASAVLKHHWPDVPNVGDVMEHDWSRYRGRARVVVGGPPCQAFSNAGKRQSLKDPRGGMSLEFAKIVRAIDPVYSITENVPAWLNTPDNAFGAFLGELSGYGRPIVPPDDAPGWHINSKSGERRFRWPHAGVFDGPERSGAWRIFDAQYLGLAQQRARVLVVSNNIQGAHSGKILPEFEGMRRDTSPRPKKRSKLAGNPVPGTREGRTFRREELRFLARRMGLAMEGRAEETPWAGETGEPGSDAEFADLARTVGRTDPSSGMEGEPSQVRPENQTVSALTAHGVGASGPDDNQGQGGHIIAVKRVAGDSSMPELAGTIAGHAARARGSCVSTSQLVPHMPEPASTLLASASLGQGAGTQPGHIVPALATHDLSPCLQERGGKGPDSDCTQAFVLEERQSSHSTPASRGEGNPATAAARSRSATPDERAKEVQSRRLFDLRARMLMPSECARLQGFPDDHCDIEYRKKPATDGPKYRGIGNAMPPHFMNFCGTRLMAAHARKEVQGR